MSEHSKSGPPKIRRRQYIVDRQMQVGTMMEVLGIVGVVGVLYAVAAIVFLSEDATFGLSSNEVRTFLIRMNGIYFILAAFILSILTIFITHRFAGPAFVMRRAIEAMRHGDFDQRLSLRKRDHLKTLAAEFSLLRDELKSADQERQTAVAELRRCLDESDIEGARKAADVLGRRPGDPSPLEQSRERASASAS